MKDMRLPYSIFEKNASECSFDECIALNFIEISKRVGAFEKLIKMTEIFWPITLIQGEPNFKLMIDNVGIANIIFKLTNSPRTAQIGHVLRNSEKEKIKKLSIIKRIMEFKEKILIDNNNSNQSVDSDEETINIYLKGLLGADLVEGFGKILPRSSSFIESQQATLDTIYNFDQAIDHAQKWFSALNMARGNRERWSSLRNMIETPINKWITDYTVQKKDLEERYKKEIAKHDGLDETDIKNQLNRQRDLVDSWVLKEQKGITERVGKMFKGIDLIFEDLQKNYKFFLNIDTLRTKPVGEVITYAYQNIANTRTAMNEIDKKLSNISEKINVIRKDLANTNLSATEKVDLYNMNLKNKQMEQTRLMKHLEIERNNQIQKIQEIQDNIKDYYQEIKNLVQEKIKHCKFDEILLKNYQIDDNISKINTPTLKLFIPIGIGIIENEDEDEHIEVIFPSYYDEQLQRKPVSSGFIDFERQVTEILDDNMRLRSNFEFTVENAVDYIPNIMNGLNFLSQKNLLSAELNEKYKLQINKIEK